MLMKTFNWTMTLLFAGLLALAGCGKEKPRAPVQQGVAIDLPKLREAFAGGSPAAQAALSEVAMGIRYVSYASALKALDTLGATPGITEPQKKVVAEVTEQIKQVASKNTSPPAR